MPEEIPTRFRNPEEDAQRAEAEIRQLAGVMGCRVVTGRDGEILEIHVVSSEERHPKQTIRDIETVLLASMGIRVDHKKISVARYPAPHTSPPQKAPRAEKGGFRVRFLSLRVTLTAEGGEAEVVLGRDRFQGFGKSGFALSADPARAIAEATLEAVRHFLEDGGFQLGSVRRTNVGDHDAVIVQVDSLQSGRTVPLLGSALVTRDANLSALHAALDAVNRLIGRMEPSAGNDIVAGPEPSTS
jgi:hypothetical protein